MILFTSAQILTFLVFASREVNSIKPKCEADHIKPWSYNEKKGDQKDYCKEPVCEADQNEQWSYSGRNGPQFWKDLYTTCNGTRQSPINIVKANAILNNTRAPITFSGYDEPMPSARMINNGHTVQISQTDNVTRSIGGGGLNDDYIFQQLHFHWGCNSCNGSEHLLDGRSYSMELHLVHANREGKLAVLAVILKASHENNTAYDPIVRSLKDVLYKGNVTNLESLLTLVNLLPKHRDTFYRYNGSLTTPECNEGVVWTVFPRVVEIGEKQLKEFRTLFSTSMSEEERCPLVNNVRPVQPLNDRPVVKYIKKFNKPKRRI